MKIKENQGKSKKNEGKKKEKKGKNMENMENLCVFAGAVALSGPRHDGSAGGRRPLPGDLCANGPGAFPRHFK